MTQEDEEQHFVCEAEKRLLVLFNHLQTGENDKVNPNHLPSHLAQTDSDADKPGELQKQTLFRPQRHNDATNIKRWVQHRIGLTIKKENSDVSKLESPETQVLRLVTECVT